MNFKWGKEFFPLTKGVKTDNFSNHNALLNPFEYIEIC